MYSQDEQSFVRLYGLSAVRLFGSQARGDADYLSDLDVLIVENGPDIASHRADLDSALNRHFGRAASIGRYTEAKIRSMYATGDLFAWHLYKESRKILTNEPDFMDNLVPQPYLEALDDINAFLEILRDSSRFLVTAPQNANYEAGILFMCSRNIAMSASWYLQGGPYFSRYSPFLLAERWGIPFPLSEAQHDANMRARVLSHRGELVPLQEPSTVLAMSQNIAGWAQKIMNSVKEIEDGSASQ